MRCSVMAAERWRMAREDDMVSKLAENYKTMKPEVYLYNVDSSACIFLL